MNKQCIWFILVLLGYLNSCSEDTSYSVSGSDNTFQSYIVQLDTVIDQGDESETRIEFFSNQYTDIVLIYGTDTVRLYDDHTHGDFLYGDFIYTASISVNKYSSTVGMFPYTFLGNGKQLSTGFIKIIESTPLYLAVTSFSIPKAFPSDELSSPISIKLDTNKLKLNDIVSVAYAHLSPTETIRWQYPLLDQKNGEFRNTFKHSELNFKTRNNEASLFAFRIETKNKTEMVYPHSITTTNKAPVVTSVKQGTKRDENGKQILPIEVSVENFEGLSEISEVVMFNQSGSSSFPFFNDGTNGDKQANDLVWTLEINVTGQSGSFKFNAIAKDLSENKTEFNIEISL